MLPPPNLQHLVGNGGLDPAKVDEAHKVLDAARSQMRSAPSFSVEERLFWAVFLLARHWAEKDDRAQALRLVLDALTMLQDPRHKQVLLGLAARSAAALGDFATANRCAADLDSRSHDLQVDTNYRLSTAYVALARNDYRTALQVLGAEIDDVPISDAYDAVCGVLRAHAHELAGHSDTAREQLLRFASSPDGLAFVEDIVKSNAALRLVPHSLPLVAERVRQMYANVVVTDSGINLKGIVLLPILGVGLAAGVEALTTQVGPPMSDWLSAVLIGAFILFSIVFAFRLVLKGPRQRRHLAQAGIAGKAQLLVIEQTGTRVNDEPMIKLRMLVQLPDRAAYTVLHKEVVPTILLSRLVPGSSVDVRVDPKNPKLMAVMWS